MNNILSAVIEKPSIVENEGFIWTGYDNLQILKQLPDNCIDNAYIDPPYNTGKKWSKNDWTFDDKFESKWHFLHFLGERLIEAKRCMNDGASLFCHVDYRMNSEIKTYLLDPLLNEKESALTLEDVNTLMMKKIGKYFHEPISIPHVIITDGPSICLDFFSGSNSYPAACYKLGRRFIGIEMNKTEQLFLDQIEGVKFGELRND